MQWVSYCNHLLSAVMRRPAFVFCLVLSVHYHDKIHHILSGINSDMRLQETSFIKDGRRAFMDVFTHLCKKNVENCIGSISFNIIITTYTYVYLHVV